MDLTVVGSVALDTVETPLGKNVEGLGGAATYFSLAAANYVPVHMVACVGQDFPDEHVSLLKSKQINLDGLEVMEGSTFRWAGRYHQDMNNRDTLDTQLNVFEQFHPKLPTAARQSPFLFLANIHPALQLEVLEQSKATFKGLDTMNLWIESELDQLKKVLAQVDALIVNDSEVELFTGERNLMKGARAIEKMGPKTVVIKKGEHGCLLVQGDQLFIVPAFLLDEVVDPTGAGDSFAGGFMGYLAQQGDTSFESLKKAIVHGTVVASFTCEKFGPDQVAAITEQDIARRFERFRQMTVF
ncbi:MAG: PfkB family carbohydrate kinase [Candidatus Hydrogenedentota bacterium]